MLSPDLALPQHVFGYHLAQEENGLRVYSNAVIETFAGNFQEIAAFGNPDAGIVDEAIDPSPM
jgi:hypothetical protein